MRSQIACPACDRRERAAERIEQALVEERIRKLEQRLDSPPEPTSAPPPVVAPEPTIDRPYVDFAPAPPAKVRREPGATLVPFIPGAVVQPATVLIAVSERYGVPVAELLGPSRLKRIMECRLAAYWLLRKLCNMSYPEIGRAMGRDHTTTITGIKKVERLRASSSAFQRFTDELALAIERESAAA